MSEAQSKIILKGRVKDDSQDPILVTLGDITLTSDQVYGNNLIVAAGANTITLPTAANLVTGKDGNTPQVGDVYRLDIGAATNAVLTIGANTGNTLKGVAAQSAGLGCSLYIRFTNVTTGVEATDVYIL